MASLAPTPKMQFFKDNGHPLVGAKLYTYYAGSTTPLTTWTDSTATTANTNPVISDARGEASVWLSTSYAYKFVLKDSSGAAIWTQDNIRNILVAAGGTEAAFNAAEAATVAASHAADAAAYLDTYIDEVILNVTFPLDLGLVGDPVIYSTFDLGAI